MRQVGQNQIVRQSHDKGGRQNLNHYYDNYTDQMAQSFYVNQSQQKSTMSAPKLNKNLSQSSHRKNKTTVLGGGSKMLGANSSSAFQHSPSLVQNLLSNQIKKTNGQTISHKSIRSHSSSRKRGASIDSTSSHNKRASTENQKYKNSYNH